MYKNMEESAVDGKTFVSQWNHAKSLIVDYVPNPENPELDSRIQACLQRIEEDKKKGAVTVVDENAELSEAATSLS